MASSSGIARVTTALASIVWAARPGGPLRAARGAPRPPIRLAHPWPGHAPAADPSAARKIALLTLRGYMLFAVIVMAIKLVQVTTAR